MATLPRKYLLISPTPSLHILFRVSSSRIQVNLIGCVTQKRCTYIKSILETISVCKKCVFKTLISCKIEMFFFFILCSPLCSPYYLCAIFHFKNFRSGGYDVTTTTTSTNFTESFPMCQYVFLGACARAWALAVVMTRLVESEILDTFELALN